MTSKKYPSYRKADITAESNEHAVTATDTAPSPDKSRGGIAERIKNFIKNRQTQGFVISVIIMAVISLVYFYPDNFDHHSLNQGDVQQGIANSKEVVDFKAQTGETSWWTNSLFGGMPTFQITPSYPSDSLFGWITTVYGLGLPSPSNLLFMMMLGFMILMVALKVRWEYGLIGAIAWGFSTYFIIIIGAGHIWKFVALSYIPPTIAGVIVAYRGRYLAGGALAALFMMMQLKANHIQMSYYFGFVVVLLGIAYLIDALRNKDKTMKKAGVKRWCLATSVLIAAFALGALANIPNLYHTAKYAKETQRVESELQASAPNEQSDSARLAYITQYSYGKNETWTLLIPNAKGGASIEIEKGQPKLKSLKGFDPESNYRNGGAQLLQDSHLFTEYFGEPESTNGPVYVGAIIFVLFVLGCVVVKGPLKWAMLAATLLSIFLAWGRNMMWLTELFIDYVPLYSSFRTPESILVIAEFTMPLMAVMGLYKILKKPDELKLYSKQIYVTFGIIAGITLLATLIPSIFGLSDESSKVIAEKYPEYFGDVMSLRADLIRDDAFRSFIFIALAFITLFSVGKKYINVKTAVAIIGILVLIDLYTVNKRYISHESFTDKPVKTEQIVEMTDVDRQILENGDNSYYRVLDADRFTQAAPSAFHHAVGGYHAAKLGRYNDLLETGMIFHPNVYNMLNAKYIVQEGQVFENPYAQGNAWFINKIFYADKPEEELGYLAAIDEQTMPYVAVADKEFQSTLGEAVTTDFTDKIELTSYAPNRLKYKSHSEADNVAVFSEIYFPWGWEATIDGQPAEIGRVNYVLRALRVPAGDHEIVFTFEPASVHRTVTIAYIAIALIYLTVLAAIVMPFILKRKEE